MLSSFLWYCRYVKYLYPYECETAKLSDPQELQMAIDSNKRDRRHSDNMDFMAPAAQLQRELVDSNLSPVVSTTPQGSGGILISSPTMALPHSSIPPYSGGFIVTGGPGGTHHVVASPLVQMTPHGIPIVIPTSTIPVSTPSQSYPPPLSSSQSQASSEERDDAQSHASGESMEPPLAKRPALQEAVKAPSSRAPYSIHQTSTGNFIMAHGGGGVASPQLIQMGGPGQLPIVVSAPPAAARDGSPHVNGKTDTSSQPESGHTVNLPAAHPPASVILGQRTTPAIPNPHNTRSLFQMSHHPNLPGLIVPQQIGAALPVPQNGEEKRKVEQDKSAGNSNPAPVKMPFANISIQPGKI